MAQNQALQNVVDTITLSTDPEKNALDAFIASGNEEAIRAAILLPEHRAYWTSKNIHFPDAVENNENFLENNGLLDIQRLFVEKRVRLGLRHADEPTLLAIINSANPEDARNAIIANISVSGLLAGNPLWNANNDVLLSQDAIVSIKTEAKRVLLLKKIEATENINLLLPVFEADGNVAQLGVANVALNHFSNDNQQEVVQAARKKACLLYVKGLSDEQIRGFYFILDANHAEFQKPDRIPLAQGLTDENMMVIRSEIGSRFLSLELLSKAGLEKSYLIELAKISNPEAFKNKIASKFSGDYLNDLIPTNVEKFRQAAAVGAIKLAIQNSHNNIALDALIQATTADHVKEVLTAHPNLGLNQDNFLSALSNSNHIQEIVGAAHVQKNLLSATFEQLRDLVLSEQLADDYKALFVPAGAPKSVKSHVDSLFAKNINWIREGALLILAKRKLSDLSEDEVYQIGRGEEEGIKNGINKIINSEENPANDIWKMDSNLAKKLPLYARLEALIRFANTENYATVKNILTNPDANLITILNSIAPEEKNEFSYRITGILLSKPNADVAHLNTLIQAKNQQEFEAALTGLGLNNLTWVTEESREPLQKIAIQSLLKTEVEQVSQFKNEAHPELLGLINPLPLKKQKTILEDPNLIKRLIDAKDEALIRNIVGDNHIQTNGLLAENKRLAILAKIQNAALLEHITRYHPEMSLSAENVIEINKALKTINAQDYETGIQQIIWNCGAYAERLTQSLGFETIYDDYISFIANDDNNAIKTSILTQKINHENIMNLGVNDAVIAARDLCLCLNKAGPFNEADFNAFQDDLKRSNTTSEFIQKINTREADTYKAKLGQGWEKQITESAFNEVKMKLNQQAFLGNQEAELSKQNTRLQDLNALLVKMEKSSKGIHSELKHFSKISSINFLNPAFQYTAKQNSIEMKQKFEELADICDPFLAECEYQMEILKRELDSLPESQNWLIVKRRNAINDHLRRVDALKELYQPAQRFLHGDPNQENILLQQGVLKTLEEVKKGKDIEFLDPPIKTMTHPISEKEKILKQGYQTQIEWRNEESDQPGLEGGANQDKYKIKDALPEGHFYEHVVTHTVNAGQFYSSFIQERNFAKQGAPRVVANHFPMPIRGVSDEELEDARIDAAMAMAISYLESAGKPTKEKPVKSFGGENAKYLYMAMLYIGKNDPNMKFGPEAINVESKKFHPDDIKASMFGLRNSELQNKFNKNASVKNYMATVKAVSREKIEGKKETNKDMNAVINRFKKDKTARETLEELKEENPERSRHQRMKGA